MLTHDNPEIKRECRSKPRPAPIYVSGRRVGDVIDDVFRKTVSGSKHQLRHPPAWAADRDSLYAAREAGARFIEIADKENGGVYRTSISRMLADGFPVNRGYGAQVALPLHLWERPDRGDQPSLFAEQEVDR